MPIKFTPQYTITTTMAKHLLRIEAAREKAIYLSISPKTLASLRETARLLTTHYSTMIEGNRLDPHQVKEVVQLKGHFPGRERDEEEVKGYFLALDHAQKWATTGIVISEEHIQLLHAYVIYGGRERVKPSPYRDGQNVIRNSQTGEIVYLPPEAKDVPDLMAAFVEWIRLNRDLPGPLLAGIAHYQFATIHPYYDGNGRTARLLTTLLLHQTGYDLKGIYSIEEYYARELEAYYEAISIGPSHNYYLGRQEADITPWLEYFLKGLVLAFERVIDQMSLLNESKTAEKMWNGLDTKQKKALELFLDSETVTSKQIADLFDFRPRTAAKLCKNWIEKGFFEIADPSNRKRKYRLSKEYREILNSNND